MVLMSLLMRSSRNDFLPVYVSSRLANSSVFFTPCHLDLTVLPKDLECSENELRRTFKQSCQLAGGGAGLGVAVAPWQSRSSASAQPKPTPRHFVSLRSFVLF